MADNAGITKITKEQPREGGDHVMVVEGVVDGQPHGILMHVEDFQNLETKDQREFERRLAERVRESYEETRR